jgi:hypothetical protein
VLADSYRADAFVDTFAGVLDRLGLSSKQPCPA